ncbi:MAG: SMP-30/gluconolactonase/LRE family protein, partial [Proteobacteria bacterium]|nr:SMP-30/gluconolactonase/LRE family protein [Pseudomonadota bacterium]
TNDHESDDPDEQFRENLFRRSLANVIHYKGGTFTRVASGLNYANGIEVSPDGASVYVASSQDRAITTYDRNPVTGALAQSRTTAIDGWPDNLNWTQDGDLLVGVHPNAYRLTQHFSDHAVLSPGRVVRAGLDSSGDTVRRIYQTDGSEISGLSVTAQYGNRLLIGAITPSYFLDCTLPERPEP